MPLANWSLRAAPSVTSASGLPNNATSPRSLWPSTRSSPTRGSGALGIGTGAARTAGGVALVVEQPATVSASVATARRDLDNFMRALAARPAANGNPAAMRPPRAGCGLSCRAIGGVHAIFRRPP